MPKPTSKSAVLRPAPARRRAAPRRTAPAGERRRQLIAAAISSIARRGLAETTIATVAREAGLSQGIINLHFRSKERLLTETLRYLSDEYRGACTAATAAAERAPAEGLLAMVELDFRREICAPDKLAVWFAFWGERKFRPTYRRICAARDRYYHGIVLAMCERLCEQGGYRQVEPALVADGLSALTTGLWLDLLVRPESMSKALARRITLCYLADVFPRHFRQPAAGGGGKSTSNA